MHQLLTWSLSRHLLWDHELSPASHRIEEQAFVIHHHWWTMSSSHFFWSQNSHQHCFFRHLDFRWPYLAHWLYQKITPPMHWRTLVTHNQSLHLSPILGLLHRHSRFLDESLLGHLRWASWVTWNEAGLSRYQRLAWNGKSWFVWTRLLSQSSISCQALKDMAKPSCKSSCSLAETVAFLGSLPWGMWPAPVWLSRPLWLWVLSFASPSLLVWTLRLTSASSFVRY